MVAHNLAVEAELRTLLQALDGAGIQHVVLKGVPLARRVNTFAEHPRVDNDIFVRRVDASRAVQVAVGLGYRSFPGRSVEADLRSNFQHPLSRPGTVIEHILEVHWSAFPPQLVPEPGLLWSRTLRLAMPGYEATILDDAATLVHLAWHYVQHQGTELRILVELGRAWDLMQPSVEFADVRLLSQALGLEHVVEFALATARSAGLTRAPIPELTSTRARLLSRWVRAETLASETPAYDHLKMWLLLAALFETRRSVRWFSARLAARLAP